MEEEILKRYFVDKMKQIDIAKELNISKYKVSRTLTKQTEYEKEKERRKKENKNKNVEETKKYINIIRKNKNDYSSTAQLKREHEQASMELSKRNTMNNRAFKNWNSSIYNYNSKKKVYELDKNVNVGFDVPKSINWKGI